MSDEAFAVSPVAVRDGSSPADAAFDAISATFMETARGRWFLDEFARRNRAADTAMVLGAIARLERAIEQQRPITGPAEEALARTDSIDIDGILASVKKIVDEIKAKVESELGSLSPDSALEALAKSARIIQEIAWGLRESGADGRICTLLDRQVEAIHAGCEQLAALKPGLTIQNAFEDAQAHIGRLAEPTPDAPLTPVLPHAADPASPAPTDAEAAASTPAIIKRTRRVTGPPIRFSDTDAPAEIEVSSRPEREYQAVAAQALSMQPDSLGANLVANGILSNPAAGRPDPLAPFKRMSQAEKIAFFS